MTLIKFKADTPAKTKERYPYFSDFFNDLFENMPVSEMKTGNVPHVNISESDDNFTLELAAPGLKKGDFKIKVENDMLTISSESKEESVEKKDKYTRKEFSYSSFMRSFTLPEIVQEEGIAASYEDGIMKVVLPKKEEAKPKAPKEIKVS